MCLQPSASEVFRQNGSQAFRGRNELRDGGVNSSRKSVIGRLSEPEDTLHMTRLLPCC